MLRYWVEAIDSESYNTDTNDLSTNFETFKPT